MQIFNIEITETLQRTITVEAETLSDAIQQVKQQYYDEKIILDADDFVEVEFNEFK